MTHSPIVEKVARAMFRMDNASDINEFADDEFRTAFDGHYLKLALAAIAAMEEPTEEMLQAGNLGPEWEGQDNIWRAMIRAALAGNPEKTP